MVFNIKLKYSSLPKFAEKSALVCFSIEGQNSAELLKNLGIELSSELVKYFSKKDVKDFTGFVNDSKPVFLHLKKIKFDKKFTSDYFRNYLAGIIEELNSKTINSLLINIPEFGLFDKYFGSEEEFSRSFVEGVQLGNYSFDAYKSDKKKPKNLNVIFTGAVKNFRKILSECEGAYHGVKFARDMANEPSNTLTPAEFVKRIRRNFRSSGVKLTVWNKAELQKRKMSAILAVGSSSDHQPFLVQMHYKPAVKAKSKIILVGKGITFDTGGYSLKPSDSMLEMKADMAGAAAVVGAVTAVAKNKLPIEVIGITPLAENVVSGGSYKPSDIIQSFAGKTIEIKNTDAEGRLILADALAFASTLKPDCILDFATLTGACYVALGDHAAGLFTNNDVLAQKIEFAGKRTYERVWRLPIWEEYFEGIKSDLADIENTGPRWGGAITAAKFLEFFVKEGIDWAHLDIAGPAVKNKSKNYTKKYNTGFGVRLAYEFLKNY